MTNYVWDYCLKDNSKFCKAWDGKDYESLPKDLKPVSGIGCKLNPESCGFAVIPIPCKTMQGSLI